MNSTTLKFNISAFSRDMGKGQDYNKLRDMLTESNYTVSAETLANGDVCMVVKDINEGVFTSMANRCNLYESENYIDEYDEIVNDEYDLESMMCEDDVYYNEDYLFNDDLDDLDDNDDIDDSYFDPEFNDVPDDESLEDDGNFEYEIDPEIEEYVKPDDIDYVYADDIDECIHEALKHRRSKKTMKLNESSSFDTDFARFKRDLADDDYIMLISCDADCDVFFDYAGECVDIDGFTNYVLDYGSYECADEEEYNAYQERLISRLKTLGLMGHCSVVEKRKGCCPPIKKQTSNNLRPISEAFTAYKEEDQKKLDKIITSIRDIVNDVKGYTIGAAEVDDAFKKLKKQQNEIKKIPRDKNTMFKITDVPGVTSAIKKMIEADPEKANEIKKFRDSLTESVITSIAAKKTSLHENVKIDGKKISKIDSKTLLCMLKEAVDTKKKFTKILSESVGNTEKSEDAKTVISNKNMLITVLAEELSYRKLAKNFQKSLLEAEEEKKEEKKTSDASDLSDEDLAVMMGGIDNTPDTETEDSKETEETEEFDIARIAISVASEDAANELKDLCVEAGIPEDAIEIESGAEDESEDDEDDAEDEENKEDKDNKKDKDDTNESIRYSNIRKLFEADDDEEAEGAKDDEDETDEDDDEEDSEETENNDVVKFILTDTDYLDELIKVLEDNYGITKKEFEEMVGFDIVDADDEEDEKDDEAFEDDDKKDDKSDKDTVDEISADEVFAGMD